MRTWFLEQLAMYAAYHRDVRNQATHHVGVPLIVYSLLVAASQLQLGSYPGPDGPIALTLGTFLLVLMVAFYLSNIPIIGFISAFIYGVLYALAEMVGQGSAREVWTTFAVCFVGGWIIQFLGHVFEGRRPALFTNATQIFMAPPFLIAEILFAVGLESNLKREVMERSRKYDITPRVA